MTTDARSLGQILLARGVLSTRELEAAVRLKDAGGGSLAVNLVLTGAVDDKTLATFYHQHFKLRRVSEAQLAQVTREIFSLIPVEIIYDTGIFPLGFEPGAASEQERLLVGVIDPSEASALDEAAFFAAFDLVPCVMSVGQMARHYLRLTGKRWRVAWETVQERRRAAQRAARIIEPVRYTTRDAPAEAEEELDEDVKLLLEQTQVLDVRLERLFDSIDEGEPLADDATVTIISLDEDEGETSEEVIELTRIKSPGDLAAALENAPEESSPRFVVRSRGEDRDFLDPVESGEVQMRFSGVEPEPHEGLDSIVVDAGLLDEDDSIDTGEVPTREQQRLRRPSRDSNRHVTPRLPRPVPLDGVERVSGDLDLPEDPGPSPVQAASVAPFGAELSIEVGSGGPMIRDAITIHILEPIEEIEGEPIDLDFPDDTPSFSDELAFTEDELDDAFFEEDAAVEVNIELEVERFTEELARVNGALMEVESDDPNDISVLSEDEIVLGDELEISVALSEDFEVELTPPADAEQASDVSLPEAMRALLEAEADVLPPASASRPSLEETSWEALSLHAEEPSTRDPIMGEEFDAEALRLAVEDALLLDDDDDDEPIILEARPPDDAMMALLASSPSRPSMEEDDDALDEASWDLAVVEEEESGQQLFPMPRFDERDDAARAQRQRAPIARGGRDEQRTTQQGHKHDPDEPGARSRTLPGVGPRAVGVVSPPSGELRFEAEVNLSPPEEPIPPVEEAMTRDLAPVLLAKPSSDEVPTAPLSVEPVIELLEEVPPGAPEPGELEGVIELSDLSEEEMLPRPIHLSSSMRAALSRPSVGMTFKLQSPPRHVPDNLLDGVAMMQAVRERDDAGRAAVSCLSALYSRVVLFSLRGQSVSVWMADVGSGERRSKLSLPLSVVACLRRSARENACYLGPVLDPGAQYGDPRLREGLTGLLQILKGGGDDAAELPLSVVVVPVCLNGRPIVLLYCDEGPGQGVLVNREGLSLVRDQMEAALERVILRRKRRPSSESSSSHSEVPNRQGASEHPP